MRLKYDSLNHQNSFDGVCSWSKIIPTRQISAVVKPHQWIDKMKKLILASVALLPATGAFADTTYVNGTTTFTHYSSGGDSGEIFNLETSFEQSFGNSMVGATFSRTIINDEDDFWTASFNGEYTLQDDFIIIGSYSISFNDGERTFNSYSLGFQYGYDNYTFGAMHNVIANDSESNGTTNIFASYEKDSYNASLYSLFEVDGPTLTGLEVGYASDHFDINGAYFIVSGAVDASAAFSIAGDYNLTDAIKVGADLSVLTINDADLTNIALTAGYEVYENVWLEGSLGQVSIDGENADSFGVSLTYEFGNKVSQTFQVGQSIADTLGDNRNLLYR